MVYVDGFVLPVKTRQLARYRSMAKQAGKIWRKYGALEFRESVADDVPVGKRTSLPRSVKLKRGETVVFLHSLPITRRPRSRHGQGHERQAHRGDDEIQKYSVRRQAHDRRRLQDHGECLEPISKLLSGLDPL
ncbi:MAG TPA: DUF1428 domain-containing protein [Sideroxyarcus sp.]|nr:DUF1428 domain-containing protein [Sideroxyarcus sp.]